MKKLSFTGLVALFALVAAACGAISPLASTPTATSTATTAPTATPSPQPTATQTPAPTATVMPSWELFTGEGFEITLPSTYDGGSTEEEMQVIIDYLRTGGNALLAQIADQNKASFRFFAVDNKPSLVFRTSMNVISNQNFLFRMATAETLAQTLKAELPNLLPGAFVVAEGSFTHPEFDAYRMVYLIDSSLLGFDEDVTTAMVQYIFLDGDTLWLVSFAAPESERLSRMAEFEESAASFKTTHD